MELLNDEDFEWSLGRMFEMTKYISMTQEELRKRGITGDEMDSVLQPMLAFREGVIEDLMIYRNKKKNKIE